MDSPSRRLFCNRTLNFRSLRAVGYDMDYTLIHYRVEEWERTAYDHVKLRLVAMGWPVQHLSFDAQMVIRGLIVDTERGNLLKCNRFGFVKQAMHGTRSLEMAALREEYSRTIVDLAEPRWQFLNTLFSLSEACLYAQLVDLLDEKKLPGVLGYADLARLVRHQTDAAHLEGKLKADILADPDRYVVKDPEAPLALLDQKHAGKKLLLITNSEWFYTKAMMTHAYDPYLPKGMTWRQLFDVVVVGARKPDFFTTRSPFFEVVTEEGLLRPAYEMKDGAAYLGGSARELERHLGMSGDELLYVGDHMFGDVHVTKNVLRWRTALILRELEDEVDALEKFAVTESKLMAKMEEKERLEARSCDLRVLVQRQRGHYGPAPEARGDIHAELASLRTQMQQLDSEIGPLARSAGELFNPRWGLLTRAGNDKSHLARQIEHYADVYTSRVSNFLLSTPFAYLRSRRGSLPHDPAIPGAPPVPAAGG
jgi:5'-nucleotidase